MSISHAAHGLMFTLAITLSLVVSINHLTAFGEPTMELCINGKCKMVSGHHGYHSQKTCINDKCGTEMLRANTTGTEMLRANTTGIVQ
ncbi:MAG: hypothetical protein E6K94_06955 [Thaumarchaeota archaeon]|nr:MAG: hypothetical protein E6K94_06955 [Nitrososphaerota archaeon]